jgi:O-antigen ligase
MKARTLETYSQSLLLFLLAFAVLWRGGKGIETTWALLGIACVSIGVSYWAHRKSGDERRVPPVLWGAVILFLLWTIASYVRSTTPNYGLDEVLRDGTLGLLFLWAARFHSVKDGKLSPFLRRFLLTLVILTFIACAIGMAVYVFQPVNRFVGSFFFYRYSTDYWPNAWAEFVLLAWPVVLWWALEGGTKRSSLFRFLLLGLVLGCLLLSYSRGAAIAFLGQIVLLKAIILFAGGKASFLRRGLATARTAALVAVVAIVVFFGANLARGQFHPVESIARKVTFTADEGASSFTERWAFYRQSLTLSAVHPFLGWGPYSFRFIQPRLETSILATSDHPHNMILKAAVERGWPAALLLLIVLAYSIVPRFFSVLRRRGEGMEPALFLLVAAAGVVAHNLIDYNLQFVAIDYPLWFFLGAIAVAADPAKRKDRARVAMRVAEITLGAFFLIVGVWEFRFLALSSLGRRAEAAGRWQQALQWYGRSEDALFSRDLDLSRASIYLRQNLFIEAETVAQRYVARNAEDARGWKTLGEIEMTLFRKDEALRDTREAFLLSRMNDIGVTNDYLNALTEAGDRKEIASMQPEILGLARSFADAIGKNTHFIALSQNVEGFDTFVRTASALYPSGAGELQKLDAEAQRAAATTRAEYSARRPGYLW